MLTESPYCPECKKEFKSEKSLKGHVVRKHLPSNIPVKMEHCIKTELPESGSKAEQDKSNQGLTHTNSRMNGQFKDTQ